MSRSANAAIKGYFYQFDNTILKLLELNNSDAKVIIENIEDIDVSEADEYTAIQCKYYEGTEYNHSLIAPTIRYMLKDYYERLRNKKDFINYKLYGFYKKGHEKLKLPLTLEYLKENFLTFSKEKKSHIYHEKIGIKDDELMEFISKVDIDIEAHGFEEQFNKIIAKIIKIFKCSFFEAEFYYYNGALKCIKDLSVKKNANDRTISKKDFLCIINKKEILFNIWFKYYKTEKEFYKKMKHEYFSSFHVSPYERFFLVEVNSTKYSRIDLKEMIDLISKKYSKISQREPTPFCPYIYIHGISENELIDLKKVLYDGDFVFTDGFPFYGANFEADKILQEANYYNKLQIKFLNKIDYINEALPLIKKTKEIFQFFLEKPFFESDNPDIKHIKIQIDDIKNIKGII